MRLRQYLGCAFAASVPWDCASPFSVEGEAATSAASGGSTAASGGASSLALLQMPGNAADSAAGTRLEAGGGQSCAAAGTRLEAGDNAGLDVSPEWVGLGRGGGQSCAAAC